MRITFGNIVCFAGYAAMLPALFSLQQNERLLIMLTELFSLFSCPLLLSFPAGTLLFTKPGWRTLPFSLSEYLKVAGSFVLVSIFVGMAGFFLAGSILPLFYFLFSSALKVISFSKIEDFAFSVSGWLFKFVLIIFTAFLQPLWGFLYFSILAAFSLLPEEKVKELIKIGTGKKEKPKTVGELIEEGMEGGL